MRILPKNMFYILMLAAPVTQAAWVGPLQVLSGNWGDQPQEFSVDWGDTPAYADYPGISDIANDGFIAISDEGHFKLYRNDGQWVRNIPVQYESPIFIVNNIVLESHKLRFISRDGAVISETDNYRNNFLGVRNGKLYLAQREPKQWRIYSPEGQLLDAVDEKPLVLGRISEDLFIYQEEKLHRITVSFPNQEWKIVSQHGSCGEYDYRTDAEGNLYCIGNQSITRYSLCGKPIVEFSLPDDTITQEDSGDPGAEDYYTVIEAYRGLEMADNGDLYASKVTQDNYSVIKWTWQDSPDDPVGGPDAPIDLSASANADGITLSWTFSLQDPGCITLYEIGRSTTAGGPYAKLADVPATGKTDAPYTYIDATAQNGTTYYYAVRVISAIANSPYSNEVRVQAE